MSLRELLACICIGMGFFGVYQLQERMAPVNYEIEKRKTFYIPSTTACKIASLGFYEIYADLLWIRSSLFYSERLLDTTGRFSSKEKEIWTERIFLAFDRATDLDPYYHSVFFAGSTLMMARSSKDERAVELLEKGYRLNPHIWEYPYQIAVYYVADYKPYYERKIKEKNWDKDWNSLAQKALEKGKYYFVKASEYPELPIGIQELITRIIAREGRLDYLEDILQVQIRNWENTKKLGSEALEKELRFEIEEDIRDRIYRSFFSNLITTLKTYHSEERFPQDELPLPTLEAFRDTQKLLNFPWNALNATPYPNIYRFYLEFPLKGEKLQTILLIEDLLFYDAETPHIKSEYLFRNELLSRKNNLQHWVNTFRAEQNRLPSSQEWENFLKLNPQFSHEIPVKYFALNEIGIVEERWKSPLDLSYLQQGILLTQHLRIFLVQRCIFELQEKVSAFFQKEQHYPSPEDFEKWILADNRYRHPNPARTYKLTPEGKVVSAFRR